MRKQLYILFCVLTAAICFADFDVRKEIIKFMEGNKELQKYLDASVTVTQTSSGSLLIRDEGIFAFQHELLTPETATEPNVVLEESVAVNPGADKLVVVTHGWMDKGENSWPDEMAAVIGERVDSNEWVCAFYDWKGGSVVITSIQAAEYARDIAGPRLAKALLELGNEEELGTKS